MNICHNNQERNIDYLVLASLIMLIFATACKHSSNEQVDNDDLLTNALIADDLSNQRVTAIAEDSKGCIWIGTFRGLNKYNAHDYHQYYCTDDSTSLIDNQINELYLDSKKRLWVGTINGACLLTDRDNFHRISMPSADKYIKQIFESKDGRVFFNTNRQILEYNEATDALELRLTFDNRWGAADKKCFIDGVGRLWMLEANKLSRYCLADFSIEKEYVTEKYITASYFDFLQNQFWLACNDEIMLFDLMEGRFMRLSPEINQNPKLKGEAISIIQPYDGQNLLLNTFTHGLYVMNLTTGKTLHHSENGFPFEVPEFGIYRMYADSQRNLWLGSYDQGIMLACGNNDQFNRDKYLQSIVKDKSVVAVGNDSQDRVWIATMHDGLHVYNLKNQQSRKVSDASVNSMAIDKNDNIWMLSLFDNRVRKCRYENGVLRVVRDVPVWSPHMVNIDHEGNVWIGSLSNAIYRIDRDTEQLTTINIDDSDGTFISGIHPIGNDRLMAIALKHKPFIIDGKSLQISDVEISEQEWGECIRRSFFIPTDIYADSFGMVWIGTVGNGLLQYNPETNSILPVPGISCTDISAIEEDRQGNMWISTQYGLCRYDRTSGRVVQFFESDGTGGNQYYDRASCVMPNGTLLFGGTHGLTAFNPINLGGKRTVPLIFEDLKIHNQIVKADQNPEVIETHLSNTPTVVLDHTQNGFSISFAALDYSKQERVHYLVMLEGRDKYWVDIKNNNECYYANLPAGDYAFKVKIDNNNNSIVPVEIALPITIKPAPWRSWWAVLCYVSIVAILLGMAVNMRRRIVANKLMAQKAIYDKEQEKRINRMNMSFFANVSHEFRTPLTMISGPLEQLQQSTAIKGADRDILFIIQRSVARMLKLVNQLMDFNKLENDTLRLQVERADVVAYVKSCISIFRVNAVSKGIDFAINGLEDSLVCTIDPDKLDKIVSNLLSNAIKYTPAGGKITLSLDVVSQADATAEIDASAHKHKTTLDAARYIKIEVADSGPGIPKESQEQIFVRYYQLADSKKGKYNWGTGIGLYYARALATLHHGALFVSGRAVNAGTAMVLLLPATDDVYSEAERVASVPLLPKPDVNYEIAEADAQPADDPEKLTVLVVDDDVEVVQYLITLLSPHYNVVSAFDAVKAIEMAAEHNPCLVISDVVMPGTDGYELCRMIKNDVQLSHIPVILVTAKTEIDSQIQGLNTGADAYVTKPFDTKYLLALMRSLISNRDKVRNILTQSTQISKIDDDILTGQDKLFMDELYGLMEKELSNSELDIVDITEMMRISRTKFYYKVKSLTGMNPAAFFKTYKLNRAAELIREGKYSMAEIADMTGFSTAAHFSTSFKKQFGVSPSAYQ